MFSSALIATLTATAFAAGALDAIGGGGGLVTLPALLAAGLPPHQALATNKGQSVFGSLTALVRYARAGLVRAERARTTFPAGFVGSLLGAALVTVTSPALLRPLVVVLLVAAASFVALHRRRSHRAGLVRAEARALALAIALVVGAYDGFFGPGTGTFLVVAFAAWLGDDWMHATADAKVVNFASNLAAVTLFSLRGAVIWHLALPMAAGQALGAALGAQLAVRRGDRLVRVVVAAVALALAVKLGLELR
ncbi:MAG: TSUP family transporter [Polyangiaceae bacterium]|nr:TSUP family transporter [Polyangiaceae bacterium]